jgi:restriction endonuclease Mrr
MPRAYSHNRVKIVTDRSSPIVYVTTGVLRAHAEELERRAHAEGLTKGAKLRDLVLRYLNGEQTT